MSNIVKAIKVYPFYTEKKGWVVDVTILGKDTFRRIVPKNVWSHISNLDNVRAKVIDWGEKRALEMMQEEQLSWAQREAQKLAIVPVAKGESINDVAPDFLAWVKATKAGSTLTQYTRNWKNYIKTFPIARKPINDIRRKDVEDFLAALATTNQHYVGRKATTGKGVKVCKEVPGLLSLKTQNAIITVINQICAYALRHDRVEKQLIVESYRIPLKPLTEDQYYSPEQVDVLLDAAAEVHPMVYYAVLIAAETGFRVAEVAGLCWDAIDYRKGINAPYGVVKVLRQVNKSNEYVKPKWDSYGSVPMTERLHLAFKKLGSDFGTQEGEVIRRVLLSKNSTRGLHKEGNVTPAILSVWMRKVTELAHAKDSSIPVSEMWHILRHSIATQIGSLTGSTLEVKAVLRQRSDSAAQIYTHHVGAKGMAAIDKQNKERESEKAKQLNTKEIAGSHLRLVK